MRSSALPHPDRIRSALEECPYRRLLCATTIRGSRGRLGASGRGKAKAAPRRGVQKARPLPNLTLSPLNVVNDHGSLFKAYPWCASSHVLRPEPPGGTISAWRGMGDPRVASPIVLEGQRRLGLDRSGTIGYPRSGSMEGPRRSRPLRQREPLRTPSWRSSQNSVKQKVNFAECPPAFIDVSQAHILDDAHGDRGWLENASSSVMAVEELPLGP